MTKLLKKKNRQIITATTGSEGILKLRKSSVDCVVLDLGLPDYDGINLLEDTANDSSINMPEVIVYTGRELSVDEHKRLENYSFCIVKKSSYAPQRLSEEVSLFLHKLEGSGKLGNSKAFDKPHIPEKALDGQRVLIVDDDMRNTFALGKILGERGLKVTMAANGKKALETLDKEPGIELVIMDLMMPVMDGYEAIKQIRLQERFSELPIIALTAKTMPEDRDKCMEAGANDYVSKPVQLDHLFSLMRILLYV